MRRFWLGLLLVVIVGAVYSWLNAPQWLEGWNEEHQEMLNRQRQAGISAGETTDQQGCVSMALQRVEHCDDSEYRCTVGGGTFFKACWQQSQPSATVCNDIPPYHEKPTEDDKAWVKDRCIEQGFLAKGCRLIMRQQQQLCSASAG
ncbi:hypothetical protein Q4508_00155 [Amphritea sp. 2_MG-2023]|jgi:hypothetical protein|uniref:hypothetical protein n=1 Tax=Amphritea TaxID=515417 RepID=UPI001C068DF6|nr:MULTISPECIES: hypothetical protein [Amphritea]MBU2967717.1 hypothetical protein [Amphritea atlantica]MDO6416965.1 hypothetical protein [Amphritea sp. 2_MG-2023]MDX2424156.1 hypothetical protein [Amphritea sp.]